MRLVLVRYVSAPHGSHCSAAGSAANVSGAHAAHCAGGTGVASSYASAVLGPAPSMVCVAGTAQMWAQPSMHAVTVSVVNEHSALHGTMQNGAGTMPRSAIAAAFARRARCAAAPSPLRRKVVFRKRPGSHATHSDSAESFTRASPA